jgi:hypothetical protein
MTSPRDPDLVIGAWLAEGPDSLPEVTRRAILVSTRSTPQQRHARWLPRRTTMRLITALSAATIVVAVVGRLGLGQLGFVATPGISPGPIDTTGWTTYTSERYGFAIGHPEGWTEDPAVGTWTLEEHGADWQSRAQEAFRNKAGSVRVSAWSVAVDPGTTAGSWLDAYCPISTTPCAGLAERTSPIAMDGHIGSLVRFTNDVQAFIPVGDRMYVVAVWRPEADPSVAPYGGATRLLEGHLSTMQLLPGGPAIDTSTWTPYESDRYGFRISHPNDWSEQPAQGAWNLATDGADWQSPAQEIFRDPDASIRVSAWSVPVEPGTTMESWLDVYCPISTTPCSGLAERTRPIAMDGHPGSLVTFTNDVQAFIPIDDRMYVAAVWRSEADPPLRPYGGATRLLKGFLSTMQLLPGGPATVWVRYGSERYGFDLGYPESWSTSAADRDWIDGDTVEPGSPAMEHFVSPDGTVQLSAWWVPLAPSVSLDEPGALEAWVEAYCEGSATTPCTEITARDVPLCVERRDCHPALMVPFDGSIQAFVPRERAEGQAGMLIVAAWGEPEAGPSPFEDRQELLEAVLATMDVWPASQPFEERIDPSR